MSARLGRGTRRGADVAGVCGGGPTGAGCFPLLALGVVSEPAGGIQLLALGVVAEQNVNPGGMFSPGVVGIV